MVSKSWGPENTLILFMVDNGPNGRRYVAGMQGMNPMHEGGIRSRCFCIGLLTSRRAFPQTRCRPHRRDTYHSGCLWIVQRAKMTAEVFSFWMETQCLA